jgi:flagellin-like hook-associated protein FlgL
LNPAVSAATRISSLKGGAVLSLTKIKLVNGLSSETVDLTRAQSITDILMTINDLGINASAIINSSKIALDVKSTSSDTAAVVCEVGEGTSASDLGIQGANDFLKTLAVLQEALEKDDRIGLLTIIGQFDLILDKLIEKSSEVGVRSNQLDAMNNRLAQSELEVSELKSDIEDADMVEYLTKFALQRTALEAIMSAAAQSVQTSLLNFLR